jgi:hypothetical protein
VGFLAQHTENMTRLEVTPELRFCPLSMDAHLTSDAALCLSPSLHPQFWLHYDKV